MIFRVNAPSRDEFTDMLKKLKADAIEFEAEKDPYFGNLKHVS